MFAGRGTGALGGGSGGQRLTHKELPRVVAHDKDAGCRAVDHVRGAVGLQQRVCRACAQPASIQAGFSAQHYLVASLRNRDSGHSDIGTSQLQ